MPVAPFPPGFHTEDVETNGAKIHVRAGGQGPAVVCLHGFGDTGDMRAPLAAALAPNHQVIVRRTCGEWASRRHPEHGYEKTAQARDIAGVMDSLGVETAALVTHDIGNMVGYALAAQFPGRVTRWAVIDAPLPGIGPWDEIVRSPLLWHFNFRGPDVERLVAGRERIYLDRFWNELSANPKAIDEETRNHYAALYARPGGHALGVQPVRRLRARRRRQPSACGGGLARHAGAGAGRRPFVRRPDGRHHAGGRVERDSRRHPSVRPLGHGGTAGPDDCRDPGIRRSRMRATPRPFVLPAAGRATAPRRRP